MNTNISLYPIIIFLVGERSCRKKMSETCHVGKIFFLKYVMSVKCLCENMSCQGKGRSKTWYVEEEYIYIEYPFHAGLEYSTVTNIRWYYKVPNIYFIVIFYV